MCIAKAISYKCDKILRCLQCYSINSKWNDQLGNNLLHLVFQDYCLEFKLKLEMALRMTNIGVDMHQPNYDCLTPLLSAIKQNSRLNYNTLLAVEINELQG